MIYDIESTGEKRPLYFKSCYCTFGCKMSKIRIILKDTENSWTNARRQLGV